MNRRQAPTTAGRAMDLVGTGGDRAGDGGWASGGRRVAAAFPQEAASILVTSGGSDNGGGTVAGGASFALLMIRGCDELSACIYDFEGSLSYLSRHSLQKWCSSCSSYVPADWYIIRKKASERVIW